MRCSGEGDAVVVLLLLWPLPPGGIEGALLVVGEGPRVGVGGTSRVEVAGGGFWARTAGEEKGEGCCCCCCWGWGPRCG